MVRRYLIFFIGLLLTAFGVAFVTKGMLGTSPIASIPFSLSLIVPALSFGVWTIVFSLVLILIQIILLRSKVNKIELVLQVVVSLVFGYLTDVSMYLLQNFNPSTYLFQMASLLIGCVIVAFGAYFSVSANVVMLPGDAFVRAVAMVLQKEFGDVRVFSDVAMSVLAAILCLVFLHELVGVREGTVIAALITGRIVKFFMRGFQPLTKMMLPKNL